MASINGSHTEATIACRSSDRPPTGLTWRFNHSQIILNRTGTVVTVSEAWRPHVKIGSEPKNLTLKALSPRQEGLYSCELHDAEESFTSIFSLRLEESRSQKTQDSPHDAGAVGGGVIGAIVIAAIIGFIKYYISRKKKSASNGQPESQEMGELMTSPREETEELEEDEERDARRGDETNISTRGSDLLHCEHALEGSVQSPGGH
ncbi:uncharacterized protein LOC130206614 [Pseudoliparis swirei]|uniref:uncharacterized protein LOC130206614 n=1 Tax=Pseudoliparis swirei TaxID=2059687 RepID=UPI0024BD829F|nr:uncharacterized protein LOC130206614 [Pseudoliparis swirei]